MKYPNIVNIIKINPDIEANTYFPFVHNHAVVTVNHSSVLKTTCSGKMCDCQRINDWNNLRGCGCIGMDTNSSSLAVQYVISIGTIDGGQETCRMREFSSLKFS